MQANRSRDTGPENALRRRLHARGVRYRVCTLPLAGVRRTADIVFRPAKVAIFVDGCFWHCCPEHSTSPATNSDFWMPKLERNVQRDRETDALLRDAGWLSMGFWEHEDPDEAAGIVEDVARRRRAVCSPAMN